MQKNYNNKDGAMELGGLYKITKGQIDKHSNINTIYQVRANTRKVNAVLKLTSSIHNNIMRSV